MPRTMTWMCRVVLIAALGALSATANAASVRLSFEPAFGPTFPLLGFQGSADIFVPDTCLDNEGKIFPSGGPTANCPAGSIVIQDAHVDLYECAPLDLTCAPTTTLETVTFAPPTITPNPVVDIVVSLVLDAGKVVGLDTTIFGPQPVTALTAVTPGDIVPATSMWARFRSNFLQPDLLLQPLDGVTPPFTVDEQALIFLGSDCSGGPNATTCIQSLPAEGTFSVVTVPEPATLALLVGALALLIPFSRSRRRTF